jgi:dolichol-phosphate mannosyltransferase
VTSNRDKTLVTVATYNEIENLPDLVDGIFEHGGDVDILVVDDNSPDGTGDWCDERNKADPRVKCLHREGKLGLGTAIIAGMKYGVDHNYLYVLNMDADFSHHPRYIPALIAGMEPSEEQEPVDVMIGSRYVPGGGVEGWPLHRHFMSRGVNIYARTLLGLRSKDCSGSFRCYRTSLLARLDFEHVRSRGYSFQEEILWHLRRLGARFGETPIVFADREKGQSKIDAREMVGALVMIFSLGVQGILGIAPSSEKNPTVTGES